MALILIADASAPERQRLRKIIETEDHVVVEADSGVYCLEIAEFHHPQCVLLSSLLVNNGSSELIQTLQGLNIPMIAIASNPPSNPPQHHLDRVAATVLTATPSQAELLTALTSALAPNVPSQPQSAKQPSAPAPTPSDTAQQLLSIERLQRLVGLGIEEAAETLSEISDCQIQFQPSVVETMTAQSLQNLLRDRFGTAPICAAQLPFIGGLSGTAQLFFPQESAATFVTALTGEEPGNPDFSDAKQEALIEVGNCVLNGVMGAMSNALTQRLTFSVPVYLEASIDALTQTLADDFSSVILLAKTDFNIQQLQVEGDIMLFFKMRLFFDLATNLST